MSLLTPDPGLLFWMLLCFLIVAFILGKWGWPAIVGMIEDRGNYIEESLKKADEANAALAGIKAENERLAAEAKNERLEMLKEATKLKEKMIEDAKTQATVEANKIIENAKESIQLEKDNAVKEIRSQVAEISVNIAERIIRGELKSNESQIDMINKLLDEVNIAKS
ncbi:MAG: F0F1 ATP synthase subunit B [Paludibacteraceae bacterium]|jgi:F-type H+-transporting ATPase subunit b|nr:F0F1 ATP synthase subunit B [Paludibacteraceae bacterium]MBR2260872.1 F0F1 ATP synthase subunit B [Paludibacteraceae bacterium]MEE3483011.1 F0F1 ATP synthase subunit B [Bacteroidales bacterium]